MNICILTGRIIHCTNVLSLNRITLSQVIICIPNTKKKLSYYKVKSIAKGKLSEHLLELAATNEICIIECFIYIKKINIIHDTRNTNRAKKTIDLKISKIYNLF